MQAYKNRHLIILRVRYGCIDYIHPFVSFARFVYRGRVIMPTWKKFRLVVPPTQLIFFPDPRGIVGTSRTAGIRKTTSAHRRVLCSFPCKARRRRRRWTPMSCGPRTVCRPPFRCANSIWGTMESRAGRAPAHARIRRDGGGPRSVWARERGGDARDAFSAPGRRRCRDALLHYEHVYYTLLLLLLLFACVSVCTLAAVAARAYVTSGRSFGRSVARCPGYNTHTTYILFQVCLRARRVCLRVCVYVCVCKQPSSPEPHKPPPRSLKL